MTEDDLLRAIFAANARLAARFPGRVAIPPGDDMAALRVRGGELLVAVDQVIAGRHFLVGTPWDLVGRKAVCRNLSDIAAMAARPLGCVASAALPADFDPSAAKALYDSLRQTAEAHDCPLVGGDTGTLPGRDDPLVVAVTVLADLPPGVQRPITRDGARPGDTLYVTGALGGSFGPDGLGHHLTFEPRIAEAIELARLLGDRLHAMIDLSDGIARDAAHLARRSRVSIRLDADRLPRQPGCDVRAALGDGEDYELCFAADGPVPAELAGAPVTAVGRVLEEGEELDDGRGGVAPSSLAIWTGGTPMDPDEVARLGWEHR